MKHNTKSVKVLFGDDSCNLIIFDGTDSAALVHALSSRFRLSQVAFHLTYPGDDAVVPLTAALPGGLTLIVRVDGSPQDQVAPRKNSDNAAAENGIPVSSWTSEPVAKLNSTFESLLTGKAFTRRECDLERGCEIKKVGFAGVAAPGLDTASFFPHSHDMQCSGNPSTMFKQGADESPKFESPKFSSAKEPLLPAIKPMTPQVSGARDTFNFLPAASPLTPQASPAVFSAVDDAMADVVRVVDRFSRLSSELANERTLLAWIRTAMAGIRGVFAFFSIPANDGNPNSFFYFCQLTMMAAVIFGGVSGTLRYNRVRNALRLPDPPQDFGRVSVMWFNATVTILTISIAIGIFSRQWVSTE
mmetsp:Transcript_80060/g.151214  ORF Transcript_80060/g.151214 Transcript_80060/m.151214 type:complete len:359 (-) Transcript_80060:13-1089(-)